MNINIKSRNGYDINCNFFIQNNDTNKVYIFLHALGGDQKRPTVLKIIENMNKMNIGAITFDFVGHGESKVCFNEFSIQKCVDDLEDVINYVKKQYPNVKIALFGTSLGGHVAIKTLIKNNFYIDSVILKSPAIDIFTALQNLKSFFNIGNDEKKFSLPLLKNFEFDFDICNYLKKESDILLNNNKIFDCPILVLQGKKDNIVFFEELFEYAKKHFANYEFKIFPNADHSFANEGEVEQVCEDITIFENNLRRKK